MMQILAYEADTDRWHVYCGNEYFCSIHCGDCFKLRVEDHYLPVRIEMDYEWYVVLDTYKIVLSPRRKYAILMP